MNATAPPSEPQLKALNSALALRYAAAGIAVHPCVVRFDRSKGKWHKQPLLIGWQSLASTDEAQIRKWWESNPHTLPGIELRRSDMIVVDADRHGGPDGVSYFAELERENEPLPRCPITHTPGSGLHFVFRQPDGETLGNRDGILGEAGVNVRGAGGWIPAPGSLRKDGGRYGPDPDAPDLIEAFISGTLPPLPEWIAALIRHKPEPAPDPEQPRGDRPAAIGDGSRERAYALAALDGECRDVARRYEGSRNNTLNRASFLLGTLVGAGWLGSHEAQTALEGAAVSCCLVKEDGWRGVRATIRSGLNAGMQKPRGPLPDRERQSPGQDAGPLPATQEPILTAEPRLVAPASLNIKATPFLLRDPILIPCREWLYGHHYIRKFLSTTVAPAGIGKSSLTKTEAVAMASGRNLIGACPVERLRVWLWNGEDPRDELERRIAAITLHYGLTAADLEGHLFVDTGREMEIVIATETRNGTVIAHPVVEALTATIRDNKIDVVIIDPFVSSHQVTENDNNAIERVAKTWARIADATGCAVELVHHVRKTAPGAEITVEDGRGAVALLAAARSGRVLNPMSDDQAAKFGIENRRLYFRVGVGKSNLAPPPEKDDWFHMMSVNLGNGPLGTGDSVGVVTTWSLPNPMADISEDDLSKAQSACASKQWRENDQAGDWVGKPIAKALGLDIGTGKSKDMTNVQKAAKAKVKLTLNTWLENGAFVRVTGKDQNRIERTFIEVGDAERVDCITR